MLTNFVFDSYDDPFFHPIRYSPTDKGEIYRGMTNVKRLLAPHVLILQMLISWFQAAKYRRPGLMLLIQRLVLISARAHRYMRFVFCFVLQVISVLIPSSLVVHTRLRLEPVSRSCCSDLGPSDVRAWTHTVRMRCGTLYTLPHLPGFPFCHCEFPRILCQGYVD